MIRRGNRGVALVISAIVALMLAYLGHPGSAAADGCANQSIRAEQGAAALALPQCRAYELIGPNSTPLVSSTGDVSYGVRAADDGNAVAYLSYYPAPDSPSSGWFYRARRGAAGWSLEAMSLQVLPGAATKLICEATELNYSQSLDASVLRIGREIKQEFPGSSFCSQPLEEVVPGEVRGFANLLRRPAPDAPYELINPPPVAGAPSNAQFQDASDDLSHIAFGEEAQLTPEAPAGYNLYLWVGGALRLVTFLPNGSPVHGDLAGATSHRVIPDGSSLDVEIGGSYTGTAPIINAVSADGERIFFYANGNLYLRQNAGQEPTAAGPCAFAEPERACTLQIDISKGAGSSGGGVFQYASVDGNRVFFTADRQLTFPSSAAAGKPALYEYNVESRTVVDHTLGAAAAADVSGFSGGSEDGARLYFVAKGALTGSQQNAAGETAQAGQPNLYLLEDGSVTFIARLDPVADRSAWGYELSAQEDGPPEVGVGSTLSTRTSPDGRYFAFNSVRGLSGGASGTRQIFLYDAVSGTVSCASCPSGGVLPPGQSALPGPITTTGTEAPGYLPRGLTNEGQLFFTTVQPLVPADTDGVADVYEHRQGELHLLSHGAAPGPSYFFDASVGAGDVFFATSDALVRADTDNALNLYDARVGGGFAEPPAPAPPCAAGESCRGAGSGAPATGILNTRFETGAGNVAAGKRCKRGKVKRKGRCVKKKRHRKHSEPRGDRRGAR